MHSCQMSSRVGIWPDPCRESVSCVSGFRPGCRSRGSGGRSDGFQRFIDLRFERDFLVDNAGTKRLELHWALQRSCQNSSSASVRRNLAELDGAISWISDLWVF